MSVAFYWTWGQDAGLGPETLGDLTDKCVGDLGAGVARHAAYLATRRHPAQVVAVDASPAQHAMATDLYGHFAPRLRIVHSDVVNHLHATAATYDVLRFPARPNSLGRHQTPSAVRKVVAIMSMAAFPAGTGPVWVK
ncbi:class I SAM-dependent methyltransferase [Streptomyces sp. DH10]|uniref:class I SAM-dependent methyltransferase n=1 Tax=Streptomyces sp. DH10 TaxID=3040121 RepID=UPI0024428B4D|nr:class I SAM-dependent methyltransferase [Streptomyces sp. DH10]MDG9713901.1 class I SAM-dependent methyltransferase [Streptomyces sp. DH10]